MKLLIQRVRKASVEVDHKIVSQIEQGLLVFIGIEQQDTLDKAIFLAKKICHLRIFEDENQKMNLSIQDVKGEILAVSQFTLCADMNRGNRPSFEHAAPPEEANILYKEFVTLLENYNIPVKTGIFQADMQVSLQNDGPATFILEK